MSDSVERLVASTRSGLNAVASIGACLDWAWKASLGCAAALLPLRFLGVGREGIALWAFLVCLAAAAGYARSLPRRLGSAQTARWLDERYGSRELLSAAIACKDRGGRGRFDAEIVESANAFAAAAPVRRIPLKALAVKASWVAALFAACLAILILAGPSRSGGDRAYSSLESPDSLSAMLEDLALKPDSFQGKESKELAYRFFPDDKRMASMVEKALRDGRIDDLRKLLERAERDFDKKIDGAESELVREEFSEQLKMLKDAVKRSLGREGSLAEELGEGAKRPRSGEVEDPGEGNRDGKPEGNPDRGAERGKEDPSREDMGSEGSARGDPDQGGKRRDGGERGREAGPGQGGAPEGEESRAAEGLGEGGSTGTKGTAPGNGFAAGTRSLDERAAGKDRSRSLELGEKDDGQMMETILPDAPGRGSYRQPVFDASRSRESALGRKDLPLEYRDYARSYFLRLNEGDANEGR